MAVCPSWPQACDALVATCVLQPRGFLDRQCIHVRAQTQRALAVATLELPDHTGSAQAARSTW